MTAGGLPGREGDPLPAYPGSGHEKSPADRACLSAGLDEADGSSLLVSVLVLQVFSAQAVGEQAVDPELVQ